MSTPPPWLPAVAAVLTGDGPPGPAPLAVTHDWHATTVLPLLAEVLPAEAAGPLRAVRELHARAARGDLPTADAWAAALEPALRAVYRQAYGYAEAYATAHRSAVDYAAANGYTDAETTEFAELYATLSSDANAASFTDANATANAVAVAAAYAAADEVGYAATWPAARARAYVHAHPDPAAAGARLAAGLADSLARVTAVTPASYAQRRLWFLAQLDGTGPAYHMPLVFRLDGAVDRAALARALDTVVARHDVLRARFEAVDGEVFQRIGDAGPDPGPALTIEYMIDRPDADERLAARLTELASAPFDLATGPLLRARLMVLAPDRSVLAVTLHHIAADGRSLGVLTRELGAAYAGEDLPPLPVRYAEHAAWQRRWLADGAAARQEAYWRAALAGAPAALDLPTDRPRPAEQDLRGGTVGFALDGDLTAALVAAGARGGGTVFMTAVAGWALLMARLSGQADVVIGTPTANRRRAELDGLVGLFVNTLALRIDTDAGGVHGDVAGAATVGDLLAHVRDVTLGALDHQDLPFERVVELVNPARGLGRTPVFQTMVAWDNAGDGAGPVLPGVTVTALAPPWAVAKFDLTLGLSISDGRIVGEVEYATALFDRATVQAWVGYLREVLTYLAGDPDRPVARVPLLTARQRRQVLDGGAGDTVPYPRDRCVHHLFEARAAADPDAVALVHGAERVTYGELDRRANRLAHHLRARGVGPDARVAVCAQRSPAAVTGLLAVLKAGGAYVPLDPAYPAERLAYLLRDSAPVVVLTDDDVLAGYDTPDTAPVVADLTPRHLAYVTYTSGTTGTPVGVQVEHRNVVAVAAAWERLLDLRPGLVHLQLASFSFDVFTADVVRALGFGGTLVFCPGEALLDSAALYGLLRDHAVDVVDIVPAVLGPLLDHLDEVDGGLAGMATVVCGSDVWTAATAARLRARCGPDVRIVNAYGLTEATVDSAYHLVPARVPAEATRLPIGRPIPNTRLYVLDGRGEPVPPGVTGEIHVGGAGVARGYLNRPELTTARFVPSPFVARDRLYRTGDLGRWAPDGELEFLGRRDAQVKIRGFRVEPAEVEARMLAHPGVKEAVVVAAAGRGSAGPAHGGTRLVGYYLGGPEPGALREWLAAALPDHMVPAPLVPLAAWPLTPNGKLDRAALPAPEPGAGGRAGPVGSMETRLAEVWADVLGVERVGRHDNFFDLGGHSLLAMRLVARVRDVLGREVSPAALFAAPTLAAFADRLTPAGADVLPPVRPGDGLAVSYAQQRLWFLAQLDGVGEAYHMPLVFRLDGWVDRVGLARALAAVVTRHEVLRSRFVGVDGEVTQRITEPAPVLVVEDLTGRDDDLPARVAAATCAPFDLATGPLLRATLLVLAPDRHVLAVTVHHIAADGWSLGVLTRELGALYAGADLPALPVRYADYAAWQRAWLADGLAARQEVYWFQRLAGAPAVLELPTDRTRPAERDFRGAVVGVEFGTELTAGLRKLAADHGGTLFMVVLAGWAAVLSRLSGQADVVIGTPTANRRRAELDGLVGFFVNTLALRIDLSGTPAVADLLGRVRDVTLGALDHQDLPFERVVELVNPARSLGHAPLFQVMLAWQHPHVDGESLALPGVVVTPVAPPWEVAKFDLVLSLEERDGRIVGGLEYATALFDPGTARAWVGYLQQILAGLVGAPDRPVAAVAMLTARQRQELVAGPAQPTVRTIRERFADQVGRRPDAVAVTGAGGSLTYAELDHRAGRLAGRLVRAGAGPDTLVGISLPRSPDLVVALVAVLKAGAAYVPLDPADPAGRRAFMIRDCEPTVVLTDTSAPPADNVEIVPHPDQLAYVLYTSGTTGRPKGVAQTWRALDTLIDWQLRYAAPDSPPPDRVLQFASINFDVSFQEIWSTLCAGGTLVLLSDDERADLGGLRRFIATNGIRRAFLPAAVLHHLAGLDDGSPPPAPPGCEIVTAGEALRVTADLRALAGRLGGAYLHNQYGPTETHVVSQHTLAAADGDRWPALPPIGRPVAGARMYVLDAHLEPVPPGVAGELYLAGAGLARGYLRRAALTAERFLPDPFGPPGARMYRSGDLARRRPDGTVDFVGRADDQVKVRGFRVEPGEVEAVLLAVPGVREAAVLLRPGDDHLTAYLAGAATVDEARGQARQVLPEYLVPTRWVRLDRLPLTGNGKVDRRALPDPDDAGTGPDFVAPRTGTEARLAAIWAEVLRRDRVGAHDDFFALGGHSLLATRLVHVVNQRMGARLSLRDLFRTPVLADLAAGLTHGAGEAFDPLTPDPAGRFEPFPLTDIQEAYWVGRGATVELGGVGAHGYTELRVPDLDVDRFAAALDRVIARHDMLRAVFHPDGTQQVRADLGPYRPTVVDLRGLDPDTAQQRLGELRDRMSHQLFDAATGPLFEFAVTRLDGEARLHLSLDALIVDAVSSQVLEHELTRCYADPDAVLPPVRVGFRDYVLAERALRDTPRYERALAYWRERAADLPPAPDLPLVRQPDSIDRPRFTRFDAVLPAPHWRRLTDLARQHAITPSVLLLTAFAQVLARWSRRPRFTLSLPLFNRLPLHPDINAVIGDFTSLVLLAVEVDPAATFAEAARATQERLWRDIDHAAVSGVRVVRELAQARGTPQAAMPVVFNSTLGELADGVSDLATALGAQSVHSITQTPQVWLDHTVAEVGGRLYLNWDAVAELFPDGLIATMFAAYRALLGRLAEPAAWRSTVEEPAPSPATAAGPLPLLPDLVDRQAAATPDAVAVLAPDRRLTYATLTAAARHLAGRLQDRGLRRGDLVAVLADRGWEQVVATLAVLYAGGAYLPLDPAWPTGRLAHVLDRARARLALVRTTRSLVLPAGVERVPVDDDTCAAGGPGLSPVPAAGTDLAYVIYTSGSTGTPKGVMIDHRGAVNTILDINDRFAVGPADRVLALSALSFDLSVYDIFGTLAAGAAVVTLDPDLARDPAHWLDLARAHGVSVWNSVPALLGLLVEYAEGGGHPLPATLRLAMLSGDWIPVALPDRLRRLLPQAEVHSLGGATEASIWSIHHPIGVVDPGWRSVPYGRALRNQSFHVLDAALRQRPTWAVGDLYIGGAGLAVGYWRDPDLTAAAFPTHPVTGERLYRTGDLGRYLPDGTIEFLGRSDGQVKVQGYRVELGEIEAALESHPAVRAAAVRVFGAAHGPKRLAAYVVPVEPDDGIDPPNLRNHLTTLVPAYMVPTSYTFLAALPLSANAKVDRARLPEPIVAVAPPAVVADGSEEAALVAVVTRLLDKGPIPLDGNLLLLGATSIDIVRIGNALSTELGFRPVLATFMRHPTLADLLGMFRDHRARAAIVATARQAAEVVEDPAGRAAFKTRDAGRRDVTGPAVDLARPADDPRYAGYRSVRRFAPAPVPAADLGGLLACLSRRDLDGAPKFLYASAGGAYPVQVYLYVKPDRVDGVPGGAYYHDPVAHRLVALGTGMRLDADAYDFFVNRPVYESGAFALFLVAELAAIEPLYGPQSLGFCQVEAGGMAHLLTAEAPGYGLGLCGIGSLADGDVDALFDLGPTHRLVYSMVGGLRPAPAVELEDIEI